MASVHLPCWQSVHPPCAVRHMGPSVSKNPQNPTSQNSQAHPTPTASARPAVFPNIPAPGGDNGPTFSDCARKHLAAKPRKGSAVLFHSIKPSGELERRSLHTACPVIRGEKWSAPKVGLQGRGEGPSAGCA